MLRFQSGWPQYLVLCQEAADWLRQGRRGVAQPRTIHATTPHGGDHLQRMILYVHKWRQRV